MDSKYGSRKFVVSMATLAVTSYLVSAGSVDAATFQAVVLGTVGVYVAGNVWQKTVTKEG